MIPETVILIEDDEHLLDVLEATLQYFGFRVTTGRTVAGFLQLPESEISSAAMVVTEFRLRDGTALDIRDACLRIHSLVQVVVMTGSLEEEQQLEGTGMESVAKPFGQADLRAAIRNCTERRRRAS